MNRDILEILLVTFFSPEFYLSINNNCCLCDNKHRVINSGVIKCMGRNSVK